jgi:hypothetical protein
MAVFICTLQRSFIILTEFRVEELVKVRYKQKQYPQTNL